MTPDSHPSSRQRSEDLHPGVRAEVRGEDPGCVPLWLCPQRGQAPAIGWRRCPRDDTSGRPAGAAAGAGLLPRTRGPSGALTGAGGPDERVNPTGSLQSGNSPFARVRLRRGPVVLGPSLSLSGSLRLVAAQPRATGRGHPGTGHPGTGALDAQRGGSQGPRGSALTRPQASASRSALPTGFGGQRRTRGPPCCLELPGVWTCEAPGGGGGGSSLHPQAPRPLVPCEPGP